jgi:hypothetical protein
VLISVSEAATILQLTSRGSLYRKVNSGEMAHVQGPGGVKLLERDGLEDRWHAVTRPKARSPKPRKPVVSVLDRAPESVPPAAQERGEVIPEYNESRAKTEYERANLLELERRQKEGLLVERKTVESTWSVLVTNAKTKLLAVPSRAKQRIPHLTLEEVEILNDLVRESLEDLAGSGAEE